MTWPRPPPAGCRAGPQGGFCPEEQGGFCPEEYESPLARRPYDLRHAAAFTWVAAGVPSTQCAEWAGHSVAVLHHVYAKVLDGQTSLARRQVEAALVLIRSRAPAELWDVLGTADRQRSVRAGDSRTQHDRGVWRFRWW